MNTIKDFPKPTIDGFLFIGDPHIGTRRPGRRKDDNFLETVLGKMKEAADIANRENLIPVILGDFFHREDDYEPYFLSKVISTLQRFHETPLCLVGNHGRYHTNISDQDALHLLGQIGLVDIIAQNSVFGRYTLRGGESVILGGTPHGYSLNSDFFHAEHYIEKSLSHEQIQKTLRAQKIIWVTHEDYAFEGMYPGAAPLTEILGIDMIVNGHIHGTKKSVLQGKTLYCNPGNIVRLSVDMKDHIPSVWKWTPKGSQLVKIPLTYIPGESIFDLTGRSQTHFSNPAIEKTESLFVSLLKQTVKTKKTEDAAFITESLQELFEKNKTQKSVQEIVLQLLDDSLKK